MKYTIKRFSSQSQDPDPKKLALGLGLSGAGAYGLLKGDPKAKKAEKIEKEYLKREAAKKAEKAALEDAFKNRGILTRIWDSVSGDKGRKKKEIKELKGEAKKLASKAEDYHGRAFRARMGGKMRKAAALSALGGGAYAFYKGMNLDD